MPKKGVFSIKLFGYYTGFFVLLFFLLGLFKVSSDYDVTINGFFLQAFSIMTGIWLLSGLLMRKYKLRNLEYREYGFYSIFTSAILSFFILKIVKFFFPTVIFGQLFFALLILGATFGEVVILLVHYYLRHAVDIEKPESYLKEKRKRSTIKAHDEKPLDNKLVEKIRQVVIESLGQRGWRWVSRYINLKSSYTVVHNTLTRVNIQLITNEVESLINLHKINDHRFINKFFETVNEKLPFGGIYVGVGETLTTRYAKTLRKTFPPFSYICLIFDFFVHRIIPKLPFLQKIYFSVTKGENRAISKAEILGRLYCCGFEVVNYTTIGGQFLFCARKVKEPSYDMMPTYGPFIALNRVGKNGNIIRVYKMRTMYPYSEYIQKYVYTQKGTIDGDKANDDFRITSWGRCFRKIWLDELPMIINWIRGDLKLVGVRPLSKVKFETYPVELQQKRIRSKPGLFPPFYADLPSSPKEMYESEDKYLEAYFKSPIKTDITYFFRAAVNIIFKGARSK